MQSVNPSDKDLGVSFIEFQGVSENKSLPLPSRKSFFSKLKLFFISLFDRILKFLGRHKKKIFLSIQILIVLILLSLTLGGLKVYSDYQGIGNIKDIIESAYKDEGSVILDKNGKVIFDYKTFLKKDPLPLAEIPSLMKDAVVVREQENYYKTSGAIPWYNIAGAAFSCAKNTVLRTGINCRGGSGLYQQLVKNATDGLNKRKSANSFADALEIKYIELLQSVKAGEDLDKDYVLEFYFNNMSFGRNSKGVQAGSKSFFGKPVKDLNVAQFCMLAAMPNSPTDYTLAVRNEILGIKPNKAVVGSSLANWEYLDNVIKSCLEKLNTLELRDGEKPVLSNQDYEKYSKFTFKDYEILDINGLEKEKDGKYPYLRDYIAYELKTKHPDIFPQDDAGFTNAINSNGYVITTTFDLDIQDRMEAVLESQRGHLNKYNANRFGSLALDTQTSAMVAMIGNSDYNRIQVNKMAGPNAGGYKPGSSIKQYVYASMFKDGFNPGTVMPDRKFSFGNYLSTNFGGNAGKGAKSIRDALQYSSNIVPQESMLIINSNNSYNPQSTIPAAVEGMQNLGLVFDRPATQSACLGSLGPAIGDCDIIASSHANAMATIFNEGVYNEVFSISEIKDKTSTLYSSTIAPSIYKKNRFVIDPSIANQVSNVLSDYATRRKYPEFDPLPYELQGWTGENQSAAKTGSAQRKFGNQFQLGDATMIGGTPKYTLLIAASNQKENGEYMPLKAQDSGSIVYPIFKAMNTSLHKGVTPVGFSKAGLKQVELDANNGLLPRGRDVPLKKEWLNADQERILNSIKDKDFVEGESIIKTRTIYPYGKSKDTSGNETVCYHKSPLFSDAAAAFFKTQINDISDLSNSCKVVIPDDVIYGPSVLDTKIINKDLIKFLEFASSNPDSSITIKKIKVSFYNQLTKLSKDMVFEGDKISVDLVKEGIDEGMYDITIFSTNSKDITVQSVKKDIKITNTKAIKEDGQVITPPTGVDGGVNPGNGNGGTNPNPNPNPTGASTGGVGSGTGSSAGSGAITPGAIVPGAINPINIKDNKKTNR